MSDIRIFPGTKAEPSALLQAACGSDMSEVLIIGLDDDGDLFISSSLAPGSIEMMGLIEIAKNAINSIEV